MHIVANRPQIAVATAIDNQGFVASSEQMPTQFVVDIEALGLNAQQPLHPRHKIGLRGFDHQVKMVAHQAIGMHLPLGFLAGLAQRLQKELPILVITDDVFTMVSPIDDVINRRSWRGMPRLCVDRCQKAINGFKQ
jgi:hypothetical protein